MIVGQIVFHHDSPGSRIRFGRLYHAGDQTTYPLELVSEGSAATLRVNNQAVSSNFKYVTGLTDRRNNSGCCAAATWVDIPGRTLTFTKTRPSSIVRVTYQDTLGTYGTDYGQCNWRVLVDGVVVLYFSAADGPSRTTSWVMENAAHQALAPGLAAGPHTVTVQNYRAPSAGECLQGWNANNQSWLGVEEVGP